MTEVEFYSENNTLLRGHILGSDGFSGDNLTLGKQAFYDGDPLTYFFVKNDFGDCSGMDLKTKHTVKRICYWFKNDDNTIREDNLYELFYFTKEGGAISLGKQYGDKKQYLIYMMSPKMPYFGCMTIHGETRDGSLHV